MKNSNRITIVFLFICAFTSCKISKSISEPYTSFFVDNNVNLYFIKPLAFQGPKSMLLVDFTFKDHQGIDSPMVICNYTILCQPNDFKSNLAIQTDTLQPVLIPQALFTEMKKDKISYRLTSKISLASFLHILHGAMFDCVIAGANTPNEKEICKASIKTKAKYKKIRSQLLPILELSTLKQ